jgi:hypothetical protein
MSLTEAGFTDASVLLTLLSAHAQLTKLSEGELQGRHYVIMMSEPLQELNDAQEVDSGLEPGRILLVIDLPTPTPVHIAGFGLQDKSFSAALAGRDLTGHLETVKLEGDFPDYFQLFCDPEHQLELREILNPETMQFLVDSCRDVQWELFGKSLFVAQSDTPPDPSQPSIGLVEGAEQLLARVVPALRRLQSHPQR